MKKLMLLPFMAIVMMVGMICSCGNGSKKQVEASEDSLAVESEKSPSNPFVGRYYKGEGNGGGMASEMAISFLADGKCVCYSDFYKAYPDKEFIHGTYEAKDDKVIVHCLVDDTTYDYEFEIKDGGKTIGFDHSDPEMGNMGMNFMTLKQVDAKTYAEATDTTTTYEAETTYEVQDLSWLQGHWVYRSADLEAHLVIKENTVMQYSTLNPEPTYYTCKVDGNQLWIKPIKNDGTDFVATLDLQNHRIDYGNGLWMHKIK